MDPATLTLPVDALRDAAYALLRRDPEARDAHLRLYELEQMLGRPAAALAHLRRALRASRIVTLPARRAPGTMAVLAFSRVAPWEANVPLELVYDEDDTTLHRLYLDDDDDESLLAAPLPDFDVAFNAIAESDRAQPALALTERLCARLGIVAMNRPELVAQLGRDRVAARFAASTTIWAPCVERVPAAALPGAAAAFPIVIRPVGSQAGTDLERIDGPAALHSYLAVRKHDTYYVMPFVNYRGGDGFYRKYRIVFVAGVPYPCHLAISPRWMIHYYNAPMSEHRWMRDEEAAFLGDLGAVFGGPLRAALDEIVAALPLDYFGIDCGIAPDGRLLLFEADAAMLVHGSDPPEVFPYKRAAFEGIKSALAAAIAARSSN